MNLTVQTNGSVTPIEALHEASDILNQMTSHLFGLSQQMLNGNEITVALNQKQKLAQATTQSSLQRPELKSNGFKSINQTNKCITESWI